MKITTALNRLVYFGADCYIFPSMHPYFSPNTISLRLQPVLLIITA